MFLIKTSRFSNLCKAEEELSASLQPIDCVHCLMDLVIQRLDLLLASSRQQEVVHLSLQSVVHLDVDVVAGGLLVLCELQLLHAYNVVDDNWI